MIKLYGEFSRGQAIDKAVQSNFVADDDIIFLIDVDMIFASLTLERIRQNTLKNRQIYLPIVFSEYTPDAMDRRPMSFHISSPLNAYSSSHLEDYATMSRHYKAYIESAKHFVDNENGYFRAFGYGLASIYKCDIMNSKINGFVTDIKGWGLEDVKFLEKILTASHQVQNQLLLSIADGTHVQFNQTTHHELDVFRTPDDSLVHIFHPIICDKRLEPNQYKMCRGTKSSTLGSFRRLKEQCYLQRDFGDFVKQVKNVVVVNWWHYVIFLIVDEHLPKLSFASWNVKVTNYWNHSQNLIYSWKIFFHLSKLPYAGTEQAKKNWNIFPEFHTWTFSLSRDKFAISYKFSTTYFHFCSPSDRRYYFFVPVAFVGTFQYEEGKKISLWETFLHENIFISVSLASLLPCASSPHFFFYKWAGKAQRTLLMWEKQRKTCVYIKRRKNRCWKNSAFSF